MLLQWLLTSVLSIFPGQTPPSTLVDVSTLKVAAPATVAELDLGKLKGELREVGWSSDGSELYIQTADGTPPSQKIRHYVVPVAGGAPKPVDAQPQWAIDYWRRRGCF